MKITDDVDLPEELIRAASSGDLVLFVGAGVYLNAPSSLPSYEGLVNKIAGLW